MAERLNWLDNNFIDRDLYAPFIVKSDVDYYDDLCKRYRTLLNDARNAGADLESLHIIKKYTRTIREALNEYYKGLISTSHTKVKNLIKDCMDESLAVDTLANSDAFGGVKGTEIQFFRARVSTSAIPYTAKEMLHLPFKMRGKTGNYRFSIPGVPSLYLGNSSYACWLELGRPAEHDFVVSPVLLDGEQRIFNLAVMNRDYHRLGEFKPDRVHTWLKLLILMIATSYRIEEEGRVFKSEYIISQSIMLACNELGLDGVAYYSKRVDDQMFSQAAINLALFAIYRYGNDYSGICEHIKIDDSFNYSLFRQLGQPSIYRGYDLRCMHTGFVNMIGNYKRQYEYQFTNFCEFDKFLFSGWEKDKIEFGHAVK